MSVKIVKESHPGPEHLKKLGAAARPIWTKEVSTFPWIYDSEETCFFLEGGVIVTPDGGAQALRLCLRRSHKSC